MAQVDPRSVRVLIVEDSLDAREMYALSLSLAGLQVQASADVRTALRLAVEWQPDVIVTDFLLAGELNGADLCRSIHDDPRTRHIPTLVMTGSTRRSDVEAILGAGCSDIRVKPYPPDAMLDDIRRLTAEASARPLTA